MNKDLLSLLLPYKGIVTSKLKPEQAMCVEFANTMRQMTLEGKLPFIWYHIPNEFLPSELKQKHMGKTDTSKNPWVQKCTQGNMRVLGGKKYRKRGFSRCPTSRRNYSFELKQKHMGKISGVPDYCFLGKDKSFFIEFKTSMGHQTPSQRAFEGWCNMMGVKYHICRSYKEGIQVVKMYI